MTKPFFDPPTEDGLRRRVYLAGPEVFLRDALEVAEKKIEICAENGLHGVFPLDPEIGPKAAWKEIFQMNWRLIESCDLLIANMTPYLGPSTDVGTAAEMGIMYGLGRPVFGYTNDSRSLVDRVPHGLDATGSPRSEEDTQIEDFGLADNLMLEGVVSASGAGVVRRSESSGDRFRDLSTFEECTRLAAMVLRATSWP